MIYSVLLVIFWLLVTNMHYWCNGGRQIYLDIGLLSHEISQRYNEVRLANQTRPLYETLENQFAWLMSNKALLATGMFQRAEKTLVLCHSKCGPQNSSTSIFPELDRNAEFLNSALPNQNLHFNKMPGWLGGLVTPRAGEHCPRRRLGKLGWICEADFSPPVRCVRWPWPSAPSPLPHLHLWQVCPWFKWTWTLGLIVEVTLTVSTALETSAHTSTNAFHVPSSLGHKQKM